MWILYVFSWGSGMVPTWLGCGQCVLPSGPFISLVFVWLMCGSCVPLVQLMCSFYVTCPWLRYGPCMFLHGQGVAGLHAPSGVDPSVPVPSPCSAVDSECPLPPPSRPPPLSCAPRPTAWTVAPAVTVIPSVAPELSSFPPCVEAQDVGA